MPAHQSNTQYMLDENEFFLYLLLPDNKSDHMQQVPVTLHHITILQGYCLSTNAPGATPRASTTCNIRLAMILA